MKVDITSLQDLPIAFIRHTGPYDDIGPAFERMIGWALLNGHLNDDTLSLGRYYDDPASVPADRLRSEACVTVPEDTKTSPGIERATIPAGKYAKTLFKGPYADIIQAYEHLYGDWLPKSGREAADAPCIEVYLNNPGTTPPDELLTEVYLPLRA